MGIITVSVEQEKGEDYIRDYAAPKLRSIISEDVKSVEISSAGSKLSVDTGDHPYKVYYVSENIGAMTALIDPTGTFTQDIETGITAAVGQSQAGYILTKSINIVSTSANAGDSVVLPVIATALGKTVKIVNNGAEAVAVFPGTGEFIDEEAVNAKALVDLAAGSTATFWIKDATTWVTLEA